MRKTGRSPNLSHSGQTSFVHCYLLILAAMIVVQQGGRRGWFPGVCSNATGGAGAAKEIIFVFAFISPLGIIPAMRATAIKKLLWLVFYSLPAIAFAANLTEPRAEVVRPQSPQNFSEPVSVIIYKSRRAQLAGVSHVPGGASKLKRGAAATLALKAFVEAQALQHGVDPNLATWIVRHESQFNPRAKGDGEASRGLWQISKIYHPEVSDAVAFSAASSTEWSLGRIREGKAYEWSTYRFCRTLYKDCPF